MTNTRSAVIAVAVALGLALAGCDSATMGDLLGSSGPDESEFDTVKRPPLSIPPDFSLRPPQPGTGAQPDAGATFYARQAVFGAKKSPNAVTSNDGRSSGTTALLRKAGVTVKDPGVRKTVDQETDELRQRETKFVDSIISHGEDGAETDAEDDSDGFLGVFGGKPKPVIEKKEEGLLESLFN